MQSISIDVTMQIEEEKENKVMNYYIVYSAIRDNDLTLTLHVIRRTVTWFNFNVQQLSQYYRRISTEREEEREANNSFFVSQPAGA